METESRKKFLINFCYIAVVGVLVFLVAKFLINYLLPFIIATVIAFLMQKPAQFIGQKFKLKKNFIAAFLSATVYFVIGFAVIFLIYRLTVALASLTTVLPSFFDRAVAIFENLNKRLSDILPKNYDSSIQVFISGILEKSADYITDFVSSSLTHIAKSTPSFLFSSVVALVASCYIAKDFDRFIRFVKDLMGKKLSANTAKIKAILVESVFKLVKGYVILSGLTYIEVLIGLLILKLKYSYLIALLVAFVDILPVLGTGTVLIPWAVISTLLGNIPLGIGIGILYVIIVLLRSFVEPKIIGTQIGINPLFTLLAMFIGLKLFGVVGLFTFPVILIVIIKYYKT